MDENMPQGGAPQPQPAPQDQPAPPPPENVGGAQEQKGMPKWVLLLGAVVVVVVLLVFVL